MYLHREDRDEAITQLAARYPKCFSVDPDHRRPLKKNIIADLEKERVMDEEMRLQVLDWYQSHFVYRRSLIAGAARIDLNGEKCGTVTPQEQEEARR